MENLLKFKVKKEHEGEKLRDFLKSGCNLSSRFCKVSAYGKNIRVNGKVVTLRHILKDGDSIEIKLNKEESQDITPEKMDLTVIYEDEDIIVLDKPPFMVVHPTKSHQSGTLANGLLNYFKEKNENCIVRLVSRLDMNTTGLILVAKNQFSHMSLQRDMGLTTFKKQYIAISHGNFTDKDGTINLPIFKDPEEAIKRTIDSRGQESITHFNVTESFKNGQVLLLTLETGRTHQIRLHLSHRGHPIYGDSLYGRDEEEYIKRQALHAYKLSFPHPRDGRIINLEAKVPEDMKQLINKLKVEE